MTIPQEKLSGEEITLSESERDEFHELRLPPTQTKAKPIEPIFVGETAVLIATGPSITVEQLAFIEQHHAAGNCRVFTVNNAYQHVSWTDVHLSCNGTWWQWYYPRSKELRNLPCLKYTWYPKLAEKFNINYISAIVKDGLSTDPTAVHINHGSGPMCINLALHFGIKRLLLIGHDMKFAPDYDGKCQKIGSKSRHFFDEYPKILQHWPSVKVGLSKPGVLDGLIEVYEKMVPQLKTVGMEIINCTPDSALTTFPMSTLEKELNKPI